MSARDKYHNQVRNALIKDGWIITHDPLRIELGDRFGYVDLGAEEVFAAEKEQRKIAVEIKSFIGSSEMNDFENAVGQYIVYNDMLEEIEPERLLYLAVSSAAYVKLFQEPLGRLLIRKRGIRLIVFDVETEVIQQWKV